MNTKMNKTALVTGATKGIGKSIAKILSESGYDVYITARTGADLERVSCEIEAKGYISADLTDVCDCKKVVDYVLEKSGRIDILINNAGAYVYSSVDNTDEEDIDKLLRLNVRAPFLLTKYVAKSMKENKWGRIVNIGSISGVVGEANASLYSLTKSAFNGFTKALALELAECNITVNTINPGWVETELANDAVEDSDFTYEEELDMIPQRRFIQPEEIGGLVKYLVSEEAKGLTAQNISLCAGLSAG